MDNPYCIKGDEFVDVVKNIDFEEESARVSISTDNKYEQLIA